VCQAADIISKFHLSFVCRKEPKEEEQRESEDSLKKDQQRSSGEQTILYPHEVKHHLRKLWDNEKHVLQHVFQAFAVNAGNMEFPVDIFFKQVQPVMPTKYRPVCMTYISSIFRLSCFSSRVFSVRHVQKIQETHQSL